MKPGDVIFFHRNVTLANFRKDPKGTFLCWVIQKATRSRWNHVAIAVSATEYAEATDRGVVITTMNPPMVDSIAMRFSSGQIIHKVSPAYVNDAQRMSAVAWARFRASSMTPYGYLDAIVCGLNDLHLTPFIAKRTRTVICSELVAECLFRADYAINEDPPVTSPGDLADLLGVQR